METSETGVQSGGTADYCCSPASQSHGRNNWPDRIHSPAPTSPTTTPQQGSHKFYNIILTCFSFFRDAFHLFEFDIQELEESLLLLGTDDESNKLVLQLVVKLLQGCLPMYKKRINKEVYSIYNLNIQINNIFFNFRISTSI